MPPSTNSVNQKENPSISKIESELRDSLRIMKMLKEDFKCKHPAFALYQIKRAILSGKGSSITRKMIIEWGNASLGGK